MSATDLLAEARIREWLARPAAEREATAPDPDPALPLEVQLMNDITALDQLAGAPATLPEDAAAMDRKAAQLMIRLMVLLEHEGRPLAAKHFAEELRAKRPTR